MTTTTAEAEQAPQTLSQPASETSHKGVLLVFAGLLIAMLLASLDQMIFSTALPTIVGELHGVEHMVWITTAYILASTIVMPVYGKLGDLVGRKWLFVSAIAIFLVGSVIGGLSHSMGAPDRRPRRPGPRRRWPHDPRDGDHRRRRARP